MAKNKHQDAFWLSYSDLMTSLFFIVLVLLIVSLSKIKSDSLNLEIERNEANARKEKLEQLEAERNEANARKDQLERILQLETQFEKLSQSSDLTYIKEKKMFVAKDFIGKEIFKPLDDKILDQFIPTVDKVGLSLQQIIKSLYYSNPNLSFQLIIEGNAAIPWQELQGKSYDPDNISMYILSYRRALALYRRWKAQGIDLRKYNTEIVIAGSGFNGKNRDSKVEENNKRFIIQIIPKISRPE